MIRDDLRTTTIRDVRRGCGFLLIPALVVAYLVFDLSPKWAVAIGVAGFFLFFVLPGLLPERKGKG